MSAILSCVQCLSPVCSGGLHCACGPLPEKWLETVCCERFHFCESVNHRESIWLKNSLSFCLVILVFSSCVFHSLSPLFSEHIFQKLLLSDKSVEILMTVILQTSVTTSGPGVLRKTSILPPVLLIHTQKSERICHVFFLLPLLVCNIWESPQERRSHREGEYTAL